MSENFSTDFTQRLGSLIQSHAALSAIENEFLNTSEVTPSKQKVSFQLKVALGGYQMEKFQAQISETAYERVLRKHKGHCHHFEVDSYYNMDAVNGQRCDIERHIEFSEQVIDVEENREWGIMASLVRIEQSQPKHLATTTAGQSNSSRCKEWRKRTSFMLDRFLRLDLIQIQTTTRNVLKNHVRDSYELQIEYLVNTESLMSTSAAISAMLPALYSVLQILQNSCIPLSQTRRCSILQAFTVLTGYTMKEFSYARTSLLHHSTLVEMFSATTLLPNRGTGYLVTDKAIDASPALIYLFENTVYMYCRGDGLRQITQPSMDIRKWDHSVFVGEYGDHFQAIDTVFFQGQNLMGVSNKTTSDRLDLLTMCHNDLAITYRQPPFGIKKYMFCQTPREFSDAVENLFDRFEQCGPYTIEGILILNVHASYPVDSSDAIAFQYSCIWQKKTSFTLQFANSAMDRTLYASGPHDTLCPIDDLRVTENLFPGRLAVFRFQDDQDDQDRLGRGIGTMNDTSFIRCEFLNLDTESHSPDNLAKIQEKLECFRVPLTRSKLATFSQNTDGMNNDEFPRSFTTPTSPHTEKHLIQQQQHQSEQTLFQSIMVDNDHPKDAGISNSDNSSRSNITIVAGSHPVALQPQKPRTKRNSSSVQGPAIKKQKSGVRSRRRSYVPLLIVPVPRKKLE